MADLYSPTEAAEITDEIVELTVEVLDGWYAEGRIDWENVLDRIDGTELRDGRILDMGTEMLTPAIASLKRRARAVRDM